MGNFEQALKEMNEEWINSLPNPDELPEITLSDNFKEWEKKLFMVMMTAKNRMNNL